MSDTALYSRLKSLSRFGRAPLGIALCAATLLAGLSAAPAQAVDIIDLHHNTSSGVPAAPYTVGTPVTITGVVTVAFGTFTYEYTDVWVQDATGGIMVYDTGILYEFARGDSVTIEGNIAQYRGMTEVDLSAYTLHASGAEVPAPLIVTCDDVEHAFLPDYSEPNEGRLVQINGVTWTGSWPSASGPITLHDESGSCTLYIDMTTGIQEMTPPTGPFDVIGVVKQYAGFSPPYTDSYEIMPRNVDDFQLLPGPQILVGPVETNIQHDNVTIHVETDTETTILVDFGTTDSYELGTATDGVSGTVHDVVLSGLDAATIHHYRVTVEDQVGTSSTSDLLFCSGSDPACTGEIFCLFNQSVDTEFATYEEAAGDQDFQAWIIEKIDACNYSLDIALYSFDLPDVADAIIAANARGVRVRFVYDNRETWQGEVTRMLYAGIFVIDDDYGNNTGDGLMHNKLWIFDALSPNPDEPWVVTGSWNLTTQGTYTDFQNVLAIQDQALANVCTFEFDEMWGSSIFLPNPDLAAFGTNKTDNTPKLFNVGGRELSMYFAPSDPWMGALIDEVREADHHIYFCILSFTRYDLGNEIKDRYHNIPGFAVRGVFDSAESGNSYSEYHSMVGTGDYPWDPPADVWLDSETGTLHHKYMIIDVDQASDPVIVTGSANWSTSAMTSNDENLLILHDATIANQYLQEFAERYHAAGGTELENAGAVEGEVDLAKSFRVGPNPVLRELQASFAIGRSGVVTCDLYGPDGRLVSRLLNSDLTPGEYNVRWRPEGGQLLPSGAYFMRLTTPEGEVNRQVTIVR